MDSIGDILHNLKDMDPNMINQFTKMLAKPDTSATSGIASTKTREEMIREFNQGRQHFMATFKRMGKGYAAMSHPSPSNRPRNKKKQKQLNKKTQLNPVFISELTKCDVYSDRQLTARIVVQPYKLTA
eukprot:462617_1